MLCNVINHQKNLHSEPGPSRAFQWNAADVTQGLAELYPELTESEIRAAQLTLEQYFALAWEIYEESVLKSAPVDFLHPNTYDSLTKVDSLLPLNKEK
jgi:hypothetical protein